MANTIFKLRRSSVAGKVPNTSSLSIGELAINLSDRKLYSSDGSQIFETGANLTNLNVSSNATINVLSVTSNSTVNNVIITGAIYANGEFGTEGQVLTTNGTAVYWGVGGGGGILDARQQYVGDGVTNTYTVTGGYRAGSLSVYINGVLQRNGTDTDVLDGGTFSFTTPPSNGALIDVVGVSTLYANNVNSEVNQQFTANGTANSFTISGGYLPHKVMVYLNGVKQVEGTDVDISSGSTVDFLVTPGNGYSVDVFGFNTVVLSASANLDAQYVWTNTHTFSNNVTFSKGISANGGFGSAGQVLHSNGSGLYWATDADYSTNTDAQYTWTNTHTFVQTINGTANSSLYIGSLPAANVVSDAQLQANLLLYQTSAGMVGNVAALTANNTQYVGSVASSNVVSNAQLQANLTNYQTTADLASNVVTLTSNSTNYVGTVSAANVVSNGQLQSNLANYQTSAGLSDNVATLTSNSTNYVGSVSAANVVSNAQLQANVSTLQGEITSNAATAYTNAVAYSDSKSYVNSSQLSSNLSNYAALSGATFTGNVVANNLNTTYDLNVGRNLFVSGNLTIGSNVNVIGANNLSVVDNMIYLNANSTVTNPDLGFAGNYNDGSYHHTGFFRDHSSGTWKVFDNYDPEPDASPYIDQTNTSFHLANFQANTIYIGNTSVYATINLSSFTGTSNNTLYVGSVIASNVVSNAQLIANLANYQTTAGLASNVVTLTANNANNLLGYTWASPGAIGSVTANTGTFTNVSVNTTVSVGNSTVNSTVNTSVLQISNTTGTANITPTEIFLGNSSVNCVINSTSVYVNGVDYNPTTALAIAVALS